MVINVKDNENCNMVQIYEVKEFKCFKCIGRIVMLPVYIDIIKHQRPRNSTNENCHLIVSLISITIHTIVWFTTVYIHTYNYTLYNTCHNNSSNNNKWLVYSFPIWMRIKNSSIKVGLWWHSTLIGVYKIYIIYI